MITYHAQGEDINSLKSTADFLNRVMKKRHFSSDYIKWQYVDNPVGKAIAICAMENGVVIGHYAAQPIISRINGEDIRGLFILNAAVDPAFQGKGVLRSIADHVHDQAARAGYRFMIGVGNKNSTPIYTKKFGFRALGPIDVEIGIGLPQFETTQSYFYERLWDDNSLKWRIANPACHYNIVIKDNKSVIYRQNYPLFFTIMGIFDQPTPADKAETATPLGLNIFLGLDPAIKWESNKNYISFPEWAKPSPLVVIFRELFETQIPVKKGNVLLRGIDIDAF